jgi:hypothetical protein
MAQTLQHQFLKNEYPLSQIQYKYPPMYELALFVMFLYAQSMRVGQ